MQMVLNTLLPHLLQQLKALFQPGQADEGTRALFIACRAIDQGSVVIESRVVGPVDAQPPNIRRGQLLTDTTIDIEHANTLGGQHPLMGAKRTKIDRSSSQIQGQRTDTLDRVEAQQHTAPLAQLAERRQIEAEAGAV